MREQANRRGYGYMCPSTLVNKTVSQKQAKKNELISKARGHVERCIGRVKRNKILQGVVHNTLLPLLDDILYFCVFSQHLLKLEKKEPGGDEGDWDVDEIFGDDN